MAKLLNLPGRVSKDAKPVDERVEFIVSKNLSDGQRKAGVVAKVQIRHPAVSLVVTVWSKDGRKWVGEPAQEGNKKWFPLTALNQEVLDRIMYLVNHDDEDTSAWYLNMLGEHTIKVTDETSNPDLGIEDITIDENLTNNQAGKGMVCKVNVVTTIGSFYGYTIWASKFGKSLYGNAPAEGTAEEGQRGAPGYKLSKEATAQVLSMLHKMTDFDAIVEAPAVPAVAQEAEAKAQETAKAQGFEPVGDAMFEAGEAQ